MNGWKNWETYQVVNYFGDEAQELVNEHGKTEAAEEALYELVDNDVPDRSDWLTNVFNAFMQEVDWHEIIQAQDDPKWEVGDEATVGALPDYWVLDDDVALAELGEEAEGWFRILKTDAGEFWGVAGYSIHEWTPIERVA